MNWEVFVGERSASEEHPGEALKIKLYVYPSKDGKMSPGEGWVA